MRALVFGIVVAAALAAAEPSLSAPFRFEEVKTVDDMRNVVRRDFSGASQDQIRAVFVSEGGATLIAHPKKTNVEKYIYDIDLCSYYVWRWNISADYDARGRVKQIYVNAEPTLGNAKKPEFPSKGPFLMIQRPRPQAFKGERSLAAVISDRDGDARTLYDAVILTGVGPTRADPLNMGAAYPYRGELWRSIFDLDDAKTVAPYAGDCSAVDAEIARRTNSGAQLPPAGR